MFSPLHQQRVDHPRDLVCHRGFLSEYSTCKSICLLACIQMVRVDLNIPFEYVERQGYITAY